MNDTKLQHVSDEVLDEVLSAEPHSDASRFTAEELQSYCDQLDQIIVQVREVRASFGRMLKREKARFGYFAFFRRLIT